MTMKTLKVSFVSAAALALSASHSFAQSNGSVTVNVPFEFAAGTTMLPAGNYHFHEERTGVLYINSPERHKGVVVLTNPEPGGSPAESASVRFDKVNGQYSLVQVNMAGEPKHYLIRTDEKNAVSPSHLNVAAGMTNATAKSLR